MQQAMSKRCPVCECDHFYRIATWSGEAGDLYVRNFRCGTITTDDGELLNSCSAHDGRDRLCAGIAAIAVALVAFITATIIL